MYQRSASLIIQCRYINAQILAAAHGSVCSYNSYAASATQNIRVKAVCVFLPPVNMDDNKCILTISDSWSKWTLKWAFFNGYYENSIAVVTVDLCARGLYLRSEIHVNIEVALRYFFIRTRDTNLACCSFQQENTCTVDFVWLTNPLFEGKHQ